MEETKRRRGRPAKDVKRTTITFRLLPETIEKLNEIAERDGVTRGEILDVLVLNERLL